MHAVRYFDKEYQLKEDESINIGNVIYTKYGVALCKSIEVEEIEGFWEGYCVKYWDTRRKYIEDQAKVKQILLKID